MQKLAKIALTILIIGCSMFLSSQALASPQEQNSKDLLATAAAVWRGLQSDAKEQSLALKETSLDAGETGFLPMVSLIRGQDEISVDNVLSKLGDRQKQRDVKLNEKSQQWILSHDGGRSSAPIADPIQVVKGPQGYVIIDGHHDVFLGLSVGASTIPAHVVLDLSHLSIAEFWQEMKAREFVYLRQTASELAKHLPRMEDVRDNPNRYLASLLAMKVKADLKDRDFPIRDVKGTEVPVWVKVGDSVPFIEFDVARALDEAGIHYDPSWGQVVPADVIEAGRQALLKAQAMSSASRLAQLPMFETAEAARRARSDKTYLAEFLNSSFERSASHRCGSVFAPK